MVERLSILIVAVVKSGFRQTLPRFDERVVGQRRLHHLEIGTLHESEWEEQQRSENQGEAHVGYVDHQSVVPFRARHHQRSDAVAGRQHEKRAFHTQGRQENESPEQGAQHRPEGVKTGRNAGRPR